MDGEIELERKCWARNRSLRSAMCDRFAKRTPTRKNGGSKSERVWLGSEVMATVKELDRTLFVSQLLDEYASMQTLRSTPSATHVQRRHRPLPIVVGAGISASAGMPLNFELLSALGQQLGITHATYPTIYEEIKRNLKRMEEPSQAELKHYLRKLLVHGGIIREHPRLFPNISNIAVIHLLRSQVFGPVISLNVDPLLCISGNLAGTETEDPIRYLVNISQFSDLSHQDNGDFGSAPLVFQVHGTIEEPLSLRFLPGEMFDQEEAIVKSVQNAIRTASALLCVGSSLEDDVTCRIVRDWAATERSFKSFFVTCFSSKLPDHTRARLEALPDNVTVYYLVRSDSDVFFRDVVDSCVTRTSLDRANGTSRFHVSSMSDSLLRDALFRAIHTQDKGPVPFHGPQFRITNCPKLDTRLAFEIGVATLAARGPIQLADLLESSKFRALLSQQDGNTRPPAEDALARLCKHGVVRYLVQDQSGRLVSHKTFPQVASILNVHEIFLVREENATTASEFGRRLLDALGLSEPPDGLSEMIRAVEQDADSAFVRALSSVYGAMFMNARPISSHEELNVSLDRIKSDFESNVQSGRAIQCRVITETGEHLFRHAALQALLVRKTKELSKADLQSALRSWLHPILASTNEQQSLTIIVATKEASWVLQGESRLGRTKWDAVVAKLLRLLGTAPRITVLELPWAQHADHMWFYERSVTGPAAESHGVYFPKLAGRQHQSALLVAGEDVKRLKTIFDQQAFLAQPFGKQPPSPVIALTVLDGSTLVNNQVTTSTEVLVVVRSEKTNKDHRNIACVPSQRVPLSLFKDLVGHLAVANGSVTSIAIRDLLRSNGRHGVGRRSHHAVRSAVEMVLARKLGLADALELGTFEYDAIPGLVRRQHSPKLARRDSGELVYMLNILVVVKDGRHHFPLHTVSYSHIGWFPVGAVRENIDTNTGFRFPCSPAPFECGGVCVCTSDLLLRTMTVLSPSSSS